MLKAYQRALITALASVSTMPVPWERLWRRRGGVIGGVDGVLGIDDRPRFHSYVAERHYPSYEYRDELRVGAVLPDARRHTMKSRLNIRALASTDTR